MDASKPHEPTNAAVGHTDSSSLDSAQFDPSLPFGTSGNRRARWTWLAASTTAIVTFVLLCSLRPQFGADGRYYLLSSIAQVLAAIVALSATLPLAFAGLSDYLPSFGERIVASWHFRGFVIMFAGSIALALILLCFACAHELLLVASAATAIGCLASLVPYFVWIADRTRPKNHFDDLLSLADSFVRRNEGVQDLATLAEPAGEVQESLGLLGQTASVAAQRGTSRYLGHAVTSLLLFWLKYDARRVEWACERGDMVWNDFMHANGASLLAINTAAECAGRIFAKECWTGSLRPSVEVFGSIANSLPAGATPDSISIVAMHGQWRLGAVAQHVDPNGERPRIVARCIAVAIGLIEEANFPQLFDRFEYRASGWFQAVPQIDPTPELAGFRALVVEEHRAFLQRLAGRADA